MVDVLIFITGDGMGCHTQGLLEKTARPFTLDVLGAIAIGTLKWRV